MPIRYQVDSLDAVPEALRSEYAATDDGKFQLNLDNGPDVGGLKSALVKERADNKALKALGKTPQEIAEIVANAAANSGKSAEFDTLLKQHTAKSELEKATLQAERDAARAFGNNAIIDATLTTALTGGRVTAEGHDLLSEKLRSRIVIETVAGKIVTKIMGRDGKTPMVGSGPGKTATFGDLVNDARNQFPSLFAGSGAGGGGTPPKQGARLSMTLTRSEFDALPPVERSAAVRAGKTIVD